MKHFTEEEIVTQLIERYGFPEARQKVRKVELGKPIEAVNDIGETVKVFPIDLVIELPTEMLYYTGRVILINSEQLEKKTYWV